MLVIGAPNSSNSLRLAEVAERIGVPARLIERATDIDWEWLGQPATLGVTAGASAPEVLVREVVDALARALRRHRGRSRPHARAADLQAAAASWSPDARAGELPEVEIFTDGACRGNPGPGGWAALIRAGRARAASCRAASR